MTKKKRSWHTIAMMFVLTCGLCLSHLNASNGPPSTKRYRVVARNNDPTAIEQSARRSPPIAGHDDSSDDSSEDDSTDGCITDTTTPVFTSCPADIAVNAGAGGCDAVVTYTLPTAIDGCDPAPLISCDSASGSIFPTGTSLVTCTATDSSGNSTQCTFGITVNPVNEVALEVVLPGVFDPVTRCIHLVPDHCDSATSVELSFTDHDNNPDTSVRAIANVEIPCGNWTQLCAKDEQHTLFNTVTLSLSGTQYVANEALSLDGGDANNDSFIDTLDFAIYANRVGLPAANGGCPWDGTLDADFSNNGIVGIEDFTFIFVNLLMYSQCTCSPLPPGGQASGPRLSVPVSELTPDVAASADLNHDGVVDYLDVRQFELDHGLSQDLSTKMQALSR